MQNTLPNLGYWKIRGLASPIRYFMEYLNVTYEETVYEVTDGPEFDRSCWFDKKLSLGLDFPNLPYLFDGDVKITESHAILMYLGRKYKPETLGQNVSDSAKVDMVAGNLKDLNGFIIGHCYGTGDKDAIMNGLESRLTNFESFLRNKTYLIGEYLTFVDFLFYELLELIDFISGSKSLANFENLRNYLNTMRNSNFMLVHRESGRFVERPFNNKMAKINN
jgi:glutathione S-transferase